MKQNQRTQQRCSALGGSDAAKAFPDLKRHRGFRLKVPLGRWRISAVQEAIALVHVDSWQTTYHGLLPDNYIAQRSYQKRLKKWTKRLNSNPEQTRAYFTYVAENATGEIVGFIDGGLLRSDSIIYAGEIYALYILEAYQRKGFGRSLIRAIAVTLSQLGLTSITVWVLAGNPAVNFYQTLGGQLIGQKAMRIGDCEFIELAYGWADIQILIGK